MQHPGKQLVADGGLLLGADDDADPFEKVKRLVPEAFRERGRGTRTPVGARASCR